MLKGDTAMPILRKHGFMSKYGLLSVPGDSVGIGGPLRRITMEDAKHWQDNDPDWEHGARQGEHLVEWMVHQSAGISRFLARSVDESMKDMVTNRLREDIGDA